MDPAPLPPHERAWRHPSELGPPAPEPTTAGGRLLIVTTATFGLLMVGLLAIVMTPEQGDAPEAVASTVSGMRVLPVTALTVTRVSLPMVTPVGDDGMAVTTFDAVDGNSGHLRARLPSGEIVDTEVVATDQAGGLALVALPAEVETPGLDLATADPTPDDTVVVHAADPVTVSVRDLWALRVDEGTPVTDSDGHLVGLCTGADRVELRTVDSLPAAAPPSTAPATTASTPDTEPQTASPPTVAATVPATDVPATEPSPLSTGDGDVEPPATLSAGGANDGSD